LVGEVRFELSANR